jgi:hypothetical protein
MLWYKHPTARTHVATYKNQRDMQQEIENAAQYGWAVQTATNADGKRSGLRVAGGAALGFAVFPILAPVGALAGAMHKSKDTTTVIFVRVPGWEPRLPLQDKLVPIAPTQYRKKHPVQPTYTTQSMQEHQAHQMQQNIASAKLFLRVLYVLFVGLWWAPIWALLGGTLVLCKVPVGHTMLAQLPMVFCLKRGSNS